MAKKSFLRAGFPIGFFLFLAICSSARAEQEVAEQTIRATAPKFKILETTVPLRERFYGNFFCDLGRVIEGSRHGRWTEMTGEVGYRQKNVTVYGSFTYLDRLREDDYTSNIGVYFNYKNYYFHEEFGNGWNISYIYRYQNILEVSHQLHKNLHWQMGYTFRRYKGYDTHIIRPGLIYYFGDHYVSADYGIIDIDNRNGVGQYVNMKGNFAVIKNLRASGGATVGEWLYDIYGLSARKESGYIMYAMLDYQLLKRVNLRLGWSYGTEKPKFIKRSLMISATVKI